MKTIKSKTWLGVGAIALVTVISVFPAAADESAATVAKTEKSYTGTITSVDPNNHALTVRNWAMFTKTFSLGANCVYDQVDKNNATVNDLRSGEKVTVIYQDAHDVCIAGVINQEPVRFEGTVTAIDNQQHSVTLHQTALDKELQLPNDCKIVLRNGRPGTLADVPIGSHVTAMYEMPGNVPTARQIEQTSIVLTGTLTAIDLNDRTVQVNAPFASKKLIVADNCVIVINGRLDGKLSDLRPDDKLVFSYDDINGVDVVNRIAPAEVRPDSVATDASDTTSPRAGY